MNTQVQPISAMRAGVEQLEYFAMPAAKVIGLGMRCVMDRNLPNPIPAFWDSFMSAGNKEILYALPKLTSAMIGFTDDYDPKTNSFLYLICVLCPADTPVPEDFQARDIPATIVCKGRYGQWLDQCKPDWAQDGYEWSGEEGQYWNAELYLDGESTDGFRLLCAVHKAAGASADGTAK